MYSITVFFSDGPKQVQLSPNPDVDKDEGESVTFTCSADGYPAPSFSWKFNRKFISGAQQKTLTLSSLNRQQAGNYTCVARNNFGSNEKSSVLNVRCKWIGLFSGFITVHKGVL